MANFLGTSEEKRVKELLRAADRAKIEKIKDRFGLLPVKKGFLRGFAVNVRESEEPCEYGTLRVLEFEISDERKGGDGVPVRVTGTYLSRRVGSGEVVDVEDPTPHIRPITPNYVYAAYDHSMNTLRAFYPGRDDTPRRKDLTNALLTIGLPVVLVIVVVVVLQVSHVFDLALKPVVFHTRIQ
jgi:hypothetical protein